MDSGIVEHKRAFKAEKHQTTCITWAKEVIRENNNENENHGSVCKLASNLY